MKFFIIDRNIDPEIAVNLSKFGAIIYSGIVSDLYSPANTHPDIQIHFFNDSYAVCCPELFDYYKSVLPDFVNLSCGSNKTGGGYPNDASYNVAVLGCNVVCNEKFTEKIIIDYYKKMGYNIINVNQGYTKCNICIVDKKAVITEDKGIAKKLVKNHIDVCYINSGEVLLNNFDYGFIGGASGFIDENTLAFTGNIKLHKEYDKIYNFIKKYNKEIILLGDNNLFDYGSILKVEV